MVKKMATIKELSAKCGVSISTISKALNGYQDISETTRQMIIETAEAIGYFPDAHARALKMKKTYSIGVLYQDSSNQGLRNEYFAHILAAFKEETSRRGYDITFIEHNMGNRKMSYLEHCRNRNFDGVCIACAEYKEPEVLELVKGQFPVVTIDREFDGTISVTSDNINGMNHLVQYIVDAGHRKIAYIYGNDTVVTRNRIRSCQNTLSRNGITVPEGYLAESYYRDIERTRLEAAGILNLPDPPTCIIAPDDYAAIGVIKAIEEAGLKVVEDISIAGYDGISSVKVMEAELTTVRQDVNGIGLKAASLLIDLIENPEQTPLENIYMPCVLMEGNTIKHLK